MREENLVTMISSSNAFSGNAVRVTNLSKHIKGSKAIFSPPRKNIENAEFVFSSNRALSIAGKSLKMCVDKSKIVHCFKTLPTSGIPALFGKIKRKPLIVDWDDYEGFGGFADHDRFPYNHIADKFEKWVVKRADALTVVSPFLEEKAREFGYDGPIHMIQNGADIDGIRYYFPNNKGELKILFVGLLHKSSDLDFVLKSMTYVKNVKLTVLGDGPRKKEFELLAKKLNLDNIEFLGMKKENDVKKHLYSSDIALMPFVDNISNRSRSPVKLGEYLAAGKPIVTNNVGIIKNVIEHGKNGIITNDNPQDFAEGIEILRNIKTRKNISINARKTAEKLSWKNIAFDLKKVYDEILNKN
ncbi:MAG: glycosyltransferase family 4 protein [Candidatus Aenigmarchaeota archaeon]|nr:glycosyltransferase family 4 protein [Candidatus Aenigmarchaeota archaeon]